MKIAVLILCIAPVWAQAPLKPVVSPSTEKPTVARKVFTELESNFDYKLRAASAKDPFDLLGLTRGLYLPGYGAVLTTELSLIVTPPITPFHLKITPEEAAKVHQRKLENLPQLRRTMQGLWRDAALALTSVPDSEQVVVAVRVLYQPWEDTGGLPGQIVMKGSRKAALGGDIQTEEE
ncbi:MAG TPA: hypothetical protein VG096_11945 [Bryobacteraceae bacterium]|jgi:hypothetical protein|nr:hypothetical protein [Bryobacteraceae bacterium]